MAASASAHHRSQSSSRNRRSRRSLRLSNAHAFPDPTEEGVPTTSFASTSNPRHLSRSLPVRAGNGFLGSPPSPFTLVLDNPQSSRVWDEFISMSEDRQDAYLDQASRSARSSRSRQRRPSDAQELSHSVSGSNSVLTDSPLSPPMSSDHQDPVRRRLFQEDDQGDDIGSSVGELSLPPPALAESIPTRMQSMNNSLSSSHGSGRGRTLERARSRPLTVQLVTPDSPSLRPSSPPLPTATPVLDRFAYVDRRSSRKARRQCLEDDNEFMMFDMELGAGSASNPSDAVLTSPSSKGLNRLSSLTSLATLSPASSVAISASTPPSQRRPSTAQRQRLSGSLSTPPPFSMQGIPLSECKARIQRSLRHTVRRMKKSVNFVLLEAIETELLRFLQSQVYGTQLQLRELPDNCILLVTDDMDRLTCEMNGNERHLKTLLHAMCQYYDLVCSSKLKIFITFYSLYLDLSDRDGLSIRIPETYCTAERQKQRPRRRQSDPAFPAVYRTPEVRFASFLNDY